MVENYIKILSIFGFIIIYVIAFIIGGFAVKLYDTTKETMYLYKIVLFSVEIVAICTLLIIILASL